MTFSKTAIQILSSSNLYDGKFLKAFNSQDQVIGTTTKQSDATLFNVPSGGFAEGFEATDTPFGSQIGYIDMLSPSQPVLFCTDDFLDSEPFTGKLSCNTVSQDGSATNRMACKPPSSAPYELNSFAFCQPIEYGRNALWMFDKDFYNGDVPPDMGCIEVNLVVLSAPDNSGSGGGSTPTQSGPVQTPSPIQDGMVAYCSKFQYIKSTPPYCGDVANNNGISLDSFYAWNPAVNEGGECAELDDGTYVCVDIYIPGPTQDGIASDCNLYTVYEDDGEYCYGIAQDAGISLDQFYDWNPAVGTDCSELQEGYAYCIGTESS